MKKFAILAIVCAFAGVMLAGCPDSKNTAKPADNKPADNAPKTN